MTPYRVLAQNLHKRLQIRFEETLGSMAIVLRAIAHQLDPQDAIVLRESVAPELRQVVTESRPSGRRNLRQAVLIVGAELEIDLAESKRRMLATLAELRAGMSPWDDIRFTDLIQRLEREVDAIAAQEAVA